MTIADKLQLIADNVQKVFNGGRKAEHDAFWIGYFDDGERVNFDYAFIGSGWNSDTLKPSLPDGKKVKPSTASLMFFSAINITDLSDIHHWADFSNCTDATDIFYLVENVEKIGKLDFRSLPSVADMFSTCTNLREIDEIYITEKTTSGTGVFANLESLERVIFKDGSVITFRGIDVSSSINLDTESIRSILKALSSNGKLKSITFHTSHQARIEADAECSYYASAATNAGWTIAYN